MISLTFKVDGVEKEFKKDELTITDNLLAVEHTIRQRIYYQDEENLKDIKKFRELNDAYLKMFVDIFGGVFTVEQLKKANKSLVPQLEAIFAQALADEEEVGTESEEEAKK